MLPTGFETKSNYTTNSIIYLFNRTIYEYDIHSADINLCRYYNLLDEKTIDKISSLDKTRRVVKIGKLQKDPKFRESLKKAFNDIRKEFYEANDIDITDIISIKKDAIFVTKLCDVTKFGNVEFVPKNVYSSFIQLRGLEFYYNSEKCDVKGIDDDFVRLHDNGMMKIIRMFFKKMETGTTCDVLSYMNRMCSDYKLRKLPIEFYREFNANSIYRILNSEDTYDEYWDDRIDEIEISYNFINILIPLTKIGF